MTKTQTAALAALARGPVYVGNGFALPTLRVLERAGLATVTAEVIYRTTSRARTASDLDWSATITPAGLAALSA